MAKRIHHKRKLVSTQLVGLLQIGKTIHNLVTPFIGHYRCYGEDASSTNGGYRAAGYSFELRDTGEYGFLLPADQVRFLNIKKI